MSAIIASGMVLRVIPRTTYTLSGLGTSQSMEFPVAQHIDVSPFQEVDLVLRTHAATIGTGASLVANAYLDGWAPEDPATVFQTSSNVGTLTAATSGASYQVVTLSGVVGRLLIITVKGTMPGSAQTLTATISIDLVMKGGDPSGIRPAYNTYRGYR